MAYAMSRVRRFRLLILGLIVIVVASILFARGTGPGRNTTPRKLVIDKLQRTYYLHVPPRLSKDQPIPLVFVFHGGGGMPAFAERDSKFSDLADRENFLVAYPEGIGKSWNDGRKDESIPAQRDKVDDLKFVNALIDDVSKDYLVDQSRIFATGISNGAIFSHHLAANLSTRIAAIAPVVGGIALKNAADFNPQQPVSVLIVQGTDDPIVPYFGGDIRLPGSFKRSGIIATDEAVNIWVKANGCQEGPVVVALPDQNSDDQFRVEMFIYKEGRDATEVVLYKVHGGGHTWPGGIQYLPETLIGKVCRDFSGTLVIWDFFKSHPKQSHIEPK